MRKDWTGNANSVFKCLASPHHTSDERQKEDYYATDPKAAHLLISVEPTLYNIWECACGELHLAAVFDEYAKLGRASDLIDRCGNEVLDFLSNDNLHWEGDIATNPPYKYAYEFVEKALSIIDEGHYVCMFLKVTFLEGKRRKGLFRNHPPKTIYVSSSRINCAKNGDFHGLRESGGSAVAYAWYVWQKGYKGETIIKWIN